jgi:hypothetical protein
VIVPLLLKRTLFFNPISSLQFIKSDHIIDFFKDKIVFILSGEGGTLRFMYCDPSFLKAAFARALLASEATVAEEVEPLDPDFTVTALVDDNVILDLPLWERLECMISTVAAGDGIEEGAEKGADGPEEPELEAVDVVLRVL